jgi:hypothetical protein
VADDPELRDDSRPSPRDVEPVEPAEPLASVDLVERVESVEPESPLRAGAVAPSPLDSLPAPELSDDAPPPSAVVFASSDDDRLFAAALRSFFAQPDPLNTIVGGAKPFRTSFEWQTGQWVGPLSWSPWITSNRCPQWWQT